MRVKTLRKMREDLKLSKKEVAQKIGVSERYIFSIEKGERTPSDKIRGKLSKIYGVSIYEIFLANNGTKCSKEV